MTAKVDVLIPTDRRPAALAVTLTSLISQTLKDFGIIISDQTEGDDVAATGEVSAALRVLAACGHRIEVHKHLPRRGVAEQRQFLLDQTTAPYALFLDDDLILEPGVIEATLQAILAEGCGFVGRAVIGLSYAHDVRPHEQSIEFWEGTVKPELVQPGTPAWERHRLHHAANIYHIQQRLGLRMDRQRRYRVAWIGGCVMYDVAKLKDCGGFSFWRELPAAYCGEDVQAQLRVMARYGGCGLIPSGVYHMELPTTIVDRRVDTAKVLSPDIRPDINSGMAPARSIARLRAQSEAP